MARTRIFGDMMDYFSDLRYGQECKKVARTFYTVGLKACPVCDGIDPLCLINIEIKRLIAEDERRLANLTADAVERRVTDVLDHFVRGFASTDETPLLSPAGQIGRQFAASLRSMLSTSADNAAAQIKQALEDLMWSKAPAADDGEDEYRMTDEERGQAPAANECEGNES